MAVTSNTNGIIFADGSYQTKAASSAYSRSGFNRTTYSGSDLTLTSSSEPMQSIAFTGLYYRVILPDASTLTVAATPTFKITNFGKYSFSIWNYYSEKLYELAPGESVNLYLLRNDDNPGLWATDQYQLVGACNVAVASSITPFVPNYSTNTNGRTRVIGLSSSKFLIVYAVSASQSAAVVGTITGTSISYGSPVNFGEGWRLQNSAGYLNSAVTTAQGYTGLIKIDENTVLAQVVNSNSTKYLVSITISGTTPTFNSGSALNCGAYGWWGTAVWTNSSSGMVVLVRNDGESGEGEYYTPGTQLIQSVTVSGSTITAKSSLGPYSNLNTFPLKLIHCGNNVFVEITAQFSSIGYAYARPFTVNTTTGAFTTGTVKAFNQSVGVKASDYGFMFSPYGQKGVSFEVSGSSVRVGTFTTDGSTLSAYSKSAASFPEDFLFDITSCGTLGLGYPSEPNPTGQRMVYVSRRNNMIYSLKFNNDGLYVGYDVVGKTPILPEGSEIYPTTGTGAWSGLTNIVALADNYYITIGWTWILDVPYITTALVKTTYKD